MRNVSEAWDNVLICMIDEISFMTDDVFKATNEKLKNAREIIHCLLVVCQLFSVGISINCLMFKLL